MGNFIFIDTKKADYEEDMNQAMGQCLGMAVSSSGKPKMTLLAPSVGFKTTVNAEVKYIFTPLDDVDAKVDDEKATSEKSFKDEVNDDDEESQDEEEEEKIPENWTQVKYFMNILLTEEQLQANDLKITFKVGKIRLIGKVESQKDTEFEAQTRQLAQV